LLHELRGLDGFTLVERSPPQQDFAELIEPNAPTECRSFTALNGERLAVFRQGFGSELLAVADETE
jgi:hypothetical protein